MNFSKAGFVILVYVFLGILSFHGGAMPGFAQSDPATSSPSVPPTPDAIQQKKEEIRKAVQEAEKALQEKTVLEKELQLKEKAASLAKQEAETLKKEGEIQKDPEAKKKAQELSKKASQLEKEVAVKREKLSVAESKVQLTQDTVAGNRNAIETLQKELAQLRRERAAQRTLWIKLVHTLVIVLIGLALWFLKQIGTRKLEEFISEKGALREREFRLHLKTLIALFKWMTTILIFGIVGYMILEEFGINTTPFLAGAGIVGLAFGFGGQYLIRDIINGIFILLEGQIRINDVVKIGEFGGLVEGVNLRVTRLRDLEGRVIYIPNGEIKTVINFTKEFSQALLNIGVAYKENVDRVMEVIKQVGKEMREDGYFGKLILDDLDMLGVDDFADSQVTIKCRIKTLPIKQWEVAREFRRRLKNRFDELDIEIPFPHRTLYWGAASENDWMRQFARDSGDSGKETPQDKPTA